MKTRICTKCGKEKGFSCFSKSEEGRYGNGFGPIIWLWDWLKGKVKHAIVCISKR